MKQPTTKTFDARAYKRAVQTQIYEETKDLSPTELITYFREGSSVGTLGELWAQLQDQQAEPTVPIQVEE